MSPRYRSLVRRFIAVVLMVALAARSGLPPGPLAPSAVHADTIVLCGPNDPGTSAAIVQNCALGANFHNAVEQPIIDDLLQAYDLPSTDDGRLLSWQRDMARAAVFAKLVSIINTPASSRTVDEQTAVNDLASLVQARRVQAAQDAKQEYNNWSKNPCGYTPPGPFAGSYDVTDYCNSTQVGFGPPAPPTLADFEHYGAYLANIDIFTNSGLSLAAQHGAYAIGLLGAAALAAGAGVAIATLLPASAVSGLLNALFPFTYALSVAGAVALPVAALVIAVAVIIIGAIEISRIIQLPDQLDQGTTNAQAPIDLTALVQSKEGLQEVYGAFIRTTMPGYGSSNGIGTVDFPPDEPAPDYSLADRKFNIFPPTSETGTQTGQLTYLDWAGKRQTAWLDGGWFVVEDSDHNLRLSLSIDVQGPLFNYSVERDGDNFLYVGQNGDTGLGQSPTGFPYKNWNGEVDEAGLAAPDGSPPSIDVSAVTTDGAGDVVPYDFGTTATEDVKLTFTCSDAEGSGDIASCPAPLTFTGPISTTVRVQASDWSGNVENNVLGSVIIWPIGYNLPTISAGATTSDGKPYAADTWTNQPVTVHYTCGDPISGILSCPNDQVFSDQGMFDAGGQVVANSNFVNSTTFGPIKIDTTPPSIALASATTADGKTYVADTWANQPVTLHYTCSDALSGIAVGGCPDRTFGDFPGATYAAGTATDNAGNTAMSPSFGPIQVDTDDPNVSCQSVDFVYGQANAMVSATVSDRTSGPQGGQPGGTTTISAAASTSTVGPSTVSLTGQDNAGNSTTVSCPYSVGQAQTSTSLTSSVNPSVFGQAVTFTATVSVQSPGGGTPTTPVTFKDNGVAIGTATLGANGNPANVATFTTGILSLGSHPITAVYGGDLNFQGSTSAALTQNVDTDLSGYPKLPNGTYNLSNTNLSGAYFTGASLAGASLAGSNLRDAVFTGANLSSANLSNSNFKGANFTNANLSGVNLANSNLMGATGLSMATLNGVTWSKTACPDGTDSDKDGGTCVGHL